MCIWLPVKPGKLTLLYPKWLPGEHSPDGPVAGISGLKFSSKGQTIAWQRDLDNMHAFHLTIPSGAAELDVVFEVDAVPGATDNNALRTSTESLCLILWNQLLLYPAGVQSDDLQYTAKLRLPAGWELGTALLLVETTADVTQFAQVSLTTLIDSPVLVRPPFQDPNWAARPPCTCIWRPTATRRSICRRRPRRNFASWCRKPPRCSVPRTTANTIFCGP
jgi:predicted metalloprotease with PDZ domain